MELEEGQYLAQEFTLLSPVFQVQNPDELVVQHKTLKDVGATEGSFIKKQFPKASYFKIKIDKEQFPSHYNASLDACLGFKKDLDWLCINRDINYTLTTTEPDGQEFLTFPFFQPGIYALILNP